MNAALTLLVGLALFAGTLYLMQPAMVFLPSRQLVTTPADWGMAYEDVSFETTDGVELHGWYLPHPQARRTLLFLHGNAGNISYRQASIEIFHRIPFNVFIIDYRGYGRSGGRPSEQGLYRDARAAWDHLVQHRGMAPQQVAVFGRSLGGAVAADLAAEVRPGALILESTFSSARDMVQVIYPVLSWLIVSRFDFATAERVAGVTCPVLVLHSPQDEIVPYRLGRKVYEAAQSPKAFGELRGDHNGGFVASQPQYEEMLRRFVEAWMGP